MRTILLSFAIAGLVASAQTTDNPLSATVKSQYAAVKNNILRSADKMPDENYAFKPTPEVRSFGQLLGHIADANFRYCSIVIGGQPPASGVEKSKTTKADLVKAVTESFTYCDKAYDGITDATLADKVKVGAGERPKFGVLNGNTLHDQEHYGNIVTYLRLKGLVPPSSERR